MHKASLVQAAGASFVLLGPRQTKLSSSKPVVAVTAVRTGAGRARSASTWPRTWQREERASRCSGIPCRTGGWNGRSSNASRAPRTSTATSARSRSAKSTSRYIERGLRRVRRRRLRRILAAAEPEADVVLWDGGNNDMSFVQPDLSIVVADAAAPRPRAEYYPGETNLRVADVVIVNKIGTAQPATCNRAAQHRPANPRAIDHRERTRLSWSSSRGASRAGVCWWWRTARP